MKLVKSLLLGAPAALAAVVGAHAADLPSVKAAPVAYVKICDAYGAGFFYIPGTDTCLKVGGYVRAQYEYTPRGTVATVVSGATLATAKTSTTLTDNGNGGYTPSSTLTVSNAARPANTKAAATGTVTNPALSVVNSGAEDTLGWLARGRVDMDARTQSAWGTVRTVLGLRLQAGSGPFQGNASGLAYGATVPSQSVWAEAAYMQFAGFTAGRAGENFAFMPPFTWTGQHFWAGYPVGVKQLAYTATFGGGFSATIALEDKADYSYQNQAGLIYANAINGTGGFGSTVTTVYPNVVPNLVGNLRVDQAWGSAQIMGTVGQNRAYTAGGFLNNGVDGGSFNTNTGGFSANGQTPFANATYRKTGYAIGAGLKLNLPMIAAGDSLWLTAAYADGMLDQIEGNSTTSNNPDSTNNLRGLVRNDQNLWTNGVNVASTKGYSFGGLLVHYWTPTVRSVFAASYINLKVPGFVAATSWYNGGISNASAYELSGSLIWAPVTNFDIGVELAYRNLRQHVTGTAADVAGFNAINNSVSAGAAKVSSDDINARLRIQRTF